eukprot:5076926-Pleurochrysis_carterae.AAC.1
MRMTASAFSNHHVHASANSSATGWRSNEWQRISAGKHARERMKAARRRPHTSDDPDEVWGRLLKDGRAGSVA